MVINIPFNLYDSPLQIKVLDARPMNDVRLALQLKSPAIGKTAYTAMMKVSNLVLNAQSLITSSKPSILLVTAMEEQGEF